MAGRPKGSTVKKSSTEEPVEEVKAEEIVVEEVKVAEVVTEVVEPEKVVEIEVPTPVEDKVLVKETLEDVKVNGNPEKCGKCPNKYGTPVCRSCVIFKKQ